MLRGMEDRSEGGGMGARVRWLGLVLLAAGTVFLAGCFGQLFSSGLLPTLIIGEIQVVGDQGEVIFSVADMPDGGLAGIAINNLGITYQDIDGTTMVATGMNGFDVFAPDFTTTLGKGRLVAVNAAGAVVGGPIFRITFTVNGANPDVTIDPADKGLVTLSSDLGTLIDPWDLGTPKAYYAK